MSRTLDFTRNRDHMHPSKAALKRTLHDYSREVCQQLMHSPHKHLMASPDDALLFVVQVNADQSITVSICDPLSDPPVQSVTCASLFAALFLVSVPGGFVSAQCPVASWRDTLISGEASPPTSFS